VCYSVGRAAAAPRLLTVPDSHEKVAVFGDPFPRGVVGVFVGLGVGKTGCVGGCGEKATVDSLIAVRERGFVTFAWHNGMEYSPNRQELYCEKLIGSGGETAKSDDWPRLRGENCTDSIADVVQGPSGKILMSRHTDPAGHMRLAATSSQ
jgi:hypothetical protein